MTDQPALLSPEALRRRSFLRGGALAAAAGAGAVVAGAASALPAEAANGAAVTVGGSVDGAATTSIAITTPGSALPTLFLSNAGGPQLKLQALDKDFDTSALKVGEVLNTTYGPYIGVTDGTATGAVPTTLVTGDDLAALSLPYVQTPDRVLDTRTQAGRGGIISTSGKLDSAGRLKGGQYIDVGIDQADADFTVDGIFFNLTVISPLSGGYLVAYPSTSGRPAASTINFVKGGTIANGGLVGLGTVGNVFTVRLFTTTTTHVALDVTGKLLTGIPGPEALSTRARALRAGQARRASRRIQRVSGARR